MSAALNGEDDALAWDVRRVVYAVIVERGVPPSVAETAAALGISEEAARAAFLRLHDLHALFLEPDRVAVRMANPFSGAPTAFPVRANGVVYWANCAWDALGIPAALGADATIAATFADDGQPAVIEIAGGKVRGSGVVHFLRPFRRWYDDLAFTRATILLFRSEEGVAAWRRERGNEPGEILSLDRVWDLARAWYGDRLDPTFRGRSAAETEAVPRRAGLNGPFWSLADST